VGRVLTFSSATCCTFSPAFACCRYSAVFVHLAGTILLSHIVLWCLPAGKPGRAAATRGHRAPCERHQPDRSRPLRCWYILPRSRPLGRPSLQRRPLKPVGQNPVSVTRISLSLLVSRGGAGICSCRIVHPWADTMPYQRVRQGRLPGIPVHLKGGIPRAYRSMVSRRAARRRPTARHVAARRDADPCMAGRGHTPVPGRNGTGNVSPDRLGDAERRGMPGCALRGNSRALRKRGAQP
jgi:hypothetical protein